MFLKREDSRDGEVKLPGPKGIPELAYRYMVVEDKKDPDWVCHLKGVVYQVGKKEFYCRVFDETQTTKANVRVKDWTSLDEHPELVLWEGYFNRETNVARREKFVMPSASSN
jgi:hypothetical protein